MFCTFSFCPVSTQVQILLVITIQRLARAPLLLLWSRASI